MDKKITTEQIQERFKSIYEKFIVIVENNINFKNNNIELSLLLNKINSNISTVILLTSEAMFNEAKIIFRSLFESTVLFEYLIELPEKIEQYKKDDLIAEFQKIYSGYKRGYISINCVIESYNILIDDFKNVIPFEEISEGGLITYNIEKLEKYFVNRGSKPLSQQTTKIIKELLSSESTHGKLLYNLQFEFYNYYAQISHNRLNSLLNPIKPISNKELLEQIQDMYKNCVIIYKIILETLEIKFGFSDRKSVV